MTETESKEEILTDENGGNKEAAANEHNNENILKQNETDSKMENLNHETSTEKNDEANEENKENDKNNESTEENQNIENENQNLNQNVEKSKETEQNLDKLNEKSENSNENQANNENTQTNPEEKNEKESKQNSETKEEEKTEKSQNKTVQNDDDDGEPLPEEQHPLQSEWTFYFFERPNTPEEWEESIHPIGTFSTCEMFWAYYSHIMSPDQLYQDFAIQLFKEGYQAMWESESIKNGGYFTIRIKDSKQIRHYWEKLILNMIGEQLGNDPIGAVVSKRTRAKKDGTEDIWYTIELWLDFRIDDQDTRSRHKFDMMKLLVEKLSIFGYLQFEFTDFEQFKGEFTGRRKIEYYFYDGAVIKPVDAPNYNKQRKHRRQ